MAGKVGAIRAGAAYVELTLERAKFDRGLRRASRDLKAFGVGLRRITTGPLLAMRAAVDKLASSFRRLAVAAAAPLAGALKSFASFEYSMASVQARSQATAGEFAALTEKARELGRTTLFSAKDVADAMAFMALAGFSTREILQAIGPATELATAGMMDMTVASDILVRILRNMGIDTADTGHTVDVLTAAFVTANTDLIELGDAFKFVGPVARMAGLSIEGTTAAIQLISNAGLKGELAGTALRMMLLSLLAPTAGAKKWMDSYGISAVDAAGRVKTMAEIVQSMNRALRHLPSGERVKVMGEIFTARALSGVSALMAQGEDLVRGFTKALEDVGPAGAEIAAIQLNTLQGTAIMLRNSIKDLGIEVGKSLSPIRAMALLLRKVIIRVTEWVKRSPGAATALAALAVVAATLAAALTVLSPIIGVVIGLMTTLTGVLGLLTAAVGVLLSPLGGLAAVVVVLTGDFDALLAASKRAADGFKFSADIISKAVADLTTEFGALAEGISDALEAKDYELAMTILTDGLRLAWAEAVLAMTKVWNTHLGDIFDDFREFVVDVKDFYEFMRNQKARAGLGAKKAGGWLKAQGAAVVHYALTALEVPVEIVSEIIETFASGIVGGSPVVSTATGGKVVGPLMKDIEAARAKRKAELAELFDPAGSAELDRTRDVLAEERRHLEAIKEVEEARVKIAESRLKRRQAGDLGGPLEGYVRDVEEARGRLETRLRWAKRKRALRALQGYFAPRRAPGPSTVEKLELTPQQAYTAAVGGLRARLGMAAAPALAPFKRAWARRGIPPGAVGIPRELRRGLDSLLSSLKPTAKAPPPWTPFRAFSAAVKKATEVLGPLADAVRRLKEEHDAAAAALAAEAAAEAAERAEAIRAHIAEQVERGGASRGGFMGRINEIVSMHRIEELVFAAKETAKNTKKTARLLEEGGVSFA